MDKKFKDFLNESADEWTYIRVKSKEDMIILLEYLESLGYNWSSGKKPTELLPDHFINPCLKIKNKIIRGTADSEYQVGIPLSDFIGGDYKLKYIERLKEIEKIKEEEKLKHIDQDPFGEEDWVYEKNIYKSIFKPLDSTFEQLYQDIVNNFDLENLQYTDSQEYPVTFYIYNINGKILNIQLERSSNSINDKIHIEFDGRWINSRKVSRNIIYKITEFLHKQIPVKYENRFKFNWPDNSTEKWQKYKEEKRKKEILQYSDIDPFGEEDWAFESISREFEYSIEQFIDRYKKDGRRGIVELLKNREVEFKPKTMDEYKGSVCGVLPMISLKSGEKLLFDTKQFGVLEVDDEYPIFIRDRQLDEGVKWYKNGKLEPDESSEYDTVEATFDVGDRVEAGKCIYWDGRGGNINADGVWKNYSFDKSYRIEKIDFINDKSGYTGQIIKLKGTWPWFQTTGFKQS